MWTRQDLTCLSKDEYEISLSAPRSCKTINNISIKLHRNSKYDFAINIFFYLNNHELSRALEKSLRDGKYQLSIWKSLYSSSISFDMDRIDISEVDKLLSLLNSDALSVLPINDIKNGIIDIIEIVIPNLNNPQPNATNSKKLFPFWCSSDDTVEKIDLAIKDKNRLYK